MTLKPVADRLALELSLSVRNDLGLLRLGFEHPASRLRGERSNPLHHRLGLTYHYGYRACKCMYIYITNRK